MGLPELKQKIQLQIENADERLLRIVSSVFDNYLNEETNDNININNVSESIVAYDTTGKPLNLKEYNKAVDKGIADFKNGDYISHEKLLKEIKSWKMKYEIIWSISAISDLKKLNTIISEANIYSIYSAPQQIIFSEQFQIDEYRKDCRRIIEGNHKILYQFKNNQIRVIKIFNSMHNPIKSLKQCISFPKN